MSEKIKDEASWAQEFRRELLKCLTNRVKLRRVPMGYRISLPLNGTNDHLLDLSLRQTPDGRFRITDGGELAVLADEQGVSRGGFESAVNRLKSQGWKAIARKGEISAATELVMDLDTETAPCTAVDAAQDLLVTMEIMLDRSRDQEGRFEAEIRKGIAAMSLGFKLQYKHPQAHTTLQFYSSGRHIAGAILGSRGRTIVPERVAWLQMRPLYVLQQWEDKMEQSGSSTFAKHSKVVVVHDDWARIEEIQGHIEQVQAHEVLASNLGHLRKLYGGDPLGNFDSKGP